MRRNPDRLAHHIERGLTKVFATDRETWRRPIVDRGRNLLVGPDWVAHLGASKLQPYNRAYREVSASDCACLVSTAATNRLRERRRPGIDPILRVFGSASNALLDDAGSRSLPRVRSGDLWPIRWICKDFGNGP
jgi:hypothetical protein